jgi:PAS domain S-box-containing protein
LSGTNSRPDHAAKLRRQAEEIARDNAAKSPKHFEALSPEETQHMLHELQVHQIELEMQNEELRQAQVQLDTGRARYFDLYDLAPVGYVTISEQGLLLEVNLTTTTLLGVTRNELIKQPFSRFVLREDQDTYYFLHKQLFETGEPRGCELRMVKKDGTALWVRLQSSSVQDTAGLAVSRVVISDISERKRAEELLAHKDDLLRLTGEMAHVGGWEFDVATGEGTWTDEVARIHGLDPTAPTNTSLGVSFYVDESRARIETAIKQAVEHGTPYDLELEIRAANGEHKWVRTRGVPVQKQGKTVQLRGTFQDITDRKKAEAVLRESETKFRSLFENMAAASCLDELIYENGKAVDYRIIDINPAFEKIVGVTKKDTIGKRASTLYGGEIPFLDTYILVAETGKPASFEAYFPPINKYLYITASCPGKGKFSTVFSDITERIQTEAQLSQSQKMEAIGTLAGGIAHDFNNMLTGILGNIALMRSSLPSADPLLENLNAAETSARQAADLTKGLLAFSRRAVVLPVPINLTAALNATLTLLKQSLPATMEIIRDYEQTAWNVLLDQSHMTQILLNLAVNARDAMDGKGTLTIRARNEVVEEEYVQTHPLARTGEFVHLSVTDTGPGIPPEILEHLFEPFHTTKPVGSGTGLGLSIVYGAVKQAGGWITAASPEGAGENTPQKHPSDWENILGGIERTSSGATFDIYLSRCLEESTQSFTPSPLPVNAGSGTILVVEDESIVCAVAQALLSRSGYTVLTAPDGASALNVLREHPASIGLILLDMTMPGMTTDEIVQGIRALDPTVPILLNSGYTSGEAVGYMIAQGSVQGFLGKPYALDQLLNTINQLMKRT